MNKPTPRRLGWAIKAYRTSPEVHMGQVALAERIGIPSQRISNIETGRVLPTDGELKAIGKAIRVTVKDLLEVAVAGKPIVRQTNE